MALQFPDVDDDLVEKIVDKLKSQGIFDQFRKDCLADVDSRPAYQNLRDKVNRAVANFLSRQPWRDDLNKNQVRECLRKHVHQGYLEAGVNRIVEQVVKPKIFSVFTPKVEDVVYEVMGIERPANTEDRSHNRLRYLMSSMPHEKNLAELLPNDLDPVSPGSINESGNESANLNDSYTSKTMDDGDNVSRDINREFNADVNEGSNDSKVSGISELSSHGSTTKLDISESAHLPGDKSEICHSNDGVNSSEVVVKEKSKGPVDSTPGSFDFDNFSNLKEKLMKTDPLNKNADKITCVAKNTESESNDDSEKNVDDVKRLKEDSHNLVSTEDKNILKSPVPFIYSEDSIGSNSHRLRIENESTRNSLVMDCDDTSSMFLEKKSIVKEIESVSCIESLKEESQISIASNDSRIFSNFSNLKSVNDNSRGRSEGSSPDLKDDKKKDSNKQKRSSTAKSDKTDKYDSKYRSSRDSSRDRKYSKDDKKYDDKDKNKHDKDKQGESSRKESSSRDKYSSRSRDDKYRSSSRHSDKKNDDSKRDSKSSSCDDKSKKDKDSKPSHDDKSSKKDESKINSDSKSSGSKDSRYNDRKSSKRDDLKRSSDDHKSSRSKEDNRTSGSKDKSSKNYSDDDKYSKKDSKGSRSTDSKVIDRKNSSKTKDDSKRDKDVKSGSEHDESKNSKKDKSSEMKDSDKVSSGSVDKSKGENKYSSDKERKKNSNSSESNSKKDDKDSKKRKRENCSEDTAKKENRRSRDRDDGGHKDSSNSTTKDQKNDSDKKRGSNKQDKISSKSSKEPSDSQTVESDRMHNIDEINQYSMENPVYKRPKISNESDSISQLINCIGNRESNMCLNESGDSLDPSANLQIIGNLVEISNKDSSECKQESMRTAKSNDIYMNIRKIPSVLPQVSLATKPDGWRDANNKYDEESKKNVCLDEKCLSSKLSPVLNDNNTTKSIAERIPVDDFMNNNEDIDFKGFDEVSLGKSFKLVYDLEQFMKLTYGSKSLDGVKCSDKCFSLTDNNLNNININTHDYPNLLKECTVNVTDLRNSLAYSNCSFDSSFCSGAFSLADKSVNNLNNDDISDTLLRSTAHCERDSGSEERPKGCEAIVKLMENPVSSHSSEKSRKVENEDVVSLTESSSSDHCFTLPPVTEDMLDSFMKKNIGNEDNYYNSSESEEEVSSPSGTHCSSTSPQNHVVSTHEGSTFLCSQDIPSDKLLLKSEMQLRPKQEDVSFSEKDIPEQEDKKTPPRTSQRYDSSDLYKPRPLITNSSRRNRVTNKRDSDIAQGTKRSAEAMEFSENKRPR